MVGVVLTPDFRQKHLLSGVTVRRWWGKSGKNLALFLVRNNAVYKQHYKPSCPIITVVS